MEKNEMDIDKKMATLVMGFEARRQMYNVWYFSNEKAVCDVDDWHPSTDIKQAMCEVVPKMRERGFDFWIVTSVKGFGVGVLKEGKMIWVSQSADPAMAICLAAEEAIDNYMDNG